MEKYKPIQVSVLNPDFERIDVLETYQHLSHTRQAYGSGKWILRTVLSPKAYSLLVPDNLLFWKEGPREHCVYIDTATVELENTIFYLQAGGRNLRGYLDRRITWENFDFASGTVEDFARRLVQENCVTPVDADRAIPRLSLGPRLGLPQDITRTTDYENLEKLIDEISAVSGIWFDIVPDMKEKTLTFLAREGVDRTTEQSANPRVILSTARGNVIQQTFIRSNAMHRNAAVVTGEITANVMGNQFKMPQRLEINAGSGLSRRETHISTEGGHVNLFDISRGQQEMLQRGREELDNHPKIITLDSEITREIAEQLDVGDRVTTREEEFGIVIHETVTEITTYYEQGGQRTGITLGSAVPSPYERMER
jgi:hypothetical protein